MQYRTIEQMCSDAHSFTLKSDQCLTDVCTEDNLFCFHI